MTKSKNLKQKLSKLSEGLLARTTDFLLVEFFFGLHFFLEGPRSSSGIWKVSREAEEDLAHINYQTLKRAFYQLRRRGLIKAMKEEAFLTPKITEAGKRRLKEIIPFYDEERTWDGKIYLVTYDVPERKRRDRDQLRYYLGKIGCGRLQNSVWITPYNPKGVLREFIQERNLSGLVLISDVAHDGSIGKMSIEEALDEVYNLEWLNSRYGDFLEKYGGRKELTPGVRSKMIFEYLSVLKDDPQLPFKLLPQDWEGEEAHYLFQTLATRGNSTSNTHDRGS